MAVCQNGSEEALIPDVGGGVAHANGARSKASRITLAVSLSLAGNVVLFLAKLYAFIFSRSQAVLASLADSAVDIASQAVVFFCDLEMKKVDPKFPIGKTKLQTVGAILIACIMTVGAVEVIGSSVGQLGKGVRSGNPPMPSLTRIMYFILGGVILMKALLFMYCYAIRKTSDSVLVLAEDHRNDVLSNVVAVITATIAAHVQPPRWWWVDPAGGIAISLYIVWSWIQLARSQINKMIGLEAPKEVVDSLWAIADMHHDEVAVDAIRAYHFGVNYFVEIDVVVDASTSVADSHDIAVDLQRKVEVLDYVERAFVHVDYSRRDYSEHRVDWSANLSSP